MKTIEELHAHMSDIAFPLPLSTEDYSMECIRLESIIEGKYVQVTLFAYKHGCYNQNLVKWKKRLYRSGKM